MNQPRRGRGPQRTRRHEERSRRGGRMRRGDIRTALLVTLSESAGHGYEVIQTIESKSDGAWKPSPGSVYPTLQLLEDEGLLHSTERDGKRIYEITDEGRAEADERVTEAGGAPWDAARGPGGRHGELKQAMTQLHLAAKQVGMAGDAELVDKATVVLKDARKQLYRLLADED